MFIRLDVTNGLFGALEADWAGQCAAFGDDFQNYASAHIDHARGICGENPPDANYGVWALHIEGEYDGIAHVNRARIKGKDGETLRILWLLLAPKFDYEDVTPEKLAQITTELILEAINLAATDLPAQHVKIHLGNTIDRLYFSSVAVALSAAKVCKDAAVRGNWLELTL